MALFENIFGTRPAGRGEAPKEFKPRPFRKPGRLERNDPAAMRAYEEEKKAYEDDMQASIADTEKLLGKEWRKRAFERSRAEEPKRAQEALAERAAVNRNIRPADAELPPMPEEDVKGGEMVDLPGGGKASADTIRMLYKKKGERQAEKEAKETAFGRNIEARYAAAYEANKKRYEEELASRGFTTPKTREEESKFNAERMADFRFQLSEKENARRAESYVAQQYNDLKRAAMDARAKKRYEAAIELDQKANAINEAVGGNITNVTARRKFFEDMANQAIKDELQKRAEDRIAIRTKQTSANPEAVDFRPKSTGAPIGVGTESLSYDQRPQVGGATDQPFGLVPPTTTDQGVSFEAISPANVRGAEVQPETPRTTATPATPTQQPFNPPTSATQTEEDILPGISQMPVVPRDPNETPAQHNARVLEEYENSVIIPSLSQEVQSAFLSAKELNEQEKVLFSQRFTSPENRRRYNEIAKKAKEQHDILKSEIDALRKKSRNLAEYPFDSPQRKLNDQKIATLRKQLGFFAKRLY